MPNNGPDRTAGYGGPDESSAYGGYGFDRRMMGMPGHGGPMHNAYGGNPNASPTDNPPPSEQHMGGYGGPMGGYGNNPMNSGYGGPMGGYGNNPMSSGYGGGPMGGYGGGPMSGYGGGPMGGYGNNPMGSGYGGPMNNDDTAGYGPEAMGHDAPAMSGNTPDAPGGSETAPPWNKQQQQGGPWMGHQGGGYGAGPWMQGQPWNRGNMNRFSMRDAHVAKSLEVLKLVLNINPEQKEAWDKFVQGVVKSSHQSHPMQMHRFQFPPLKGDQAKTLVETLRNSLDDQQKKTADKFFDLLGVFDKV
jgi:hypothetical protein